VSGAWISAELAAALDAEGTNAHRVWSSHRAWIERFGADYLISAEDEPIARGMLAPLGERAAARRIFWRRLVRQPRETDVPALLAGDASLPLESVVTERGLRFEIDFGAGYSAGLFCDQRLNRAHLESLRPARVLNCFAFTCAFTAAAARAGAETLSIDLSNRSLDRGRRNLELNALAGARHRFLADDVFAVLPRLARRGERFDAIILDPPTFSRGAKARVFRAGEDFGRLFELACAVASTGCQILLSTNARAVTAPMLRAMALESSRALKFHAEPAPPDIGPHQGASTVWAMFT